MRPLVLLFLLGCGGGADFVLSPPAATDAGGDDGYHAASAVPVMPTTSDGATIYHGLPVDNCHAGICLAVVKAPNVAVVSCPDGNCVVQCAVDFLDCDHNPYTGCEYFGTTCP